MASLYANAWKKWVFFVCGREAEGTSKINFVGLSQHADFASCCEHVHRLNRYVDIVFKVVRSDFESMAAG